MLSRSVQRKLHNTLGPRWAMIVLGWVAADLSNHDVACLTGLRPFQIQHLRNEWQSLYELSHLRYVKGNLDLSSSIPANDTTPPTTNQKKAS